MLKVVEALVAGVKVRKGLAVSVTFQDGEDVRSEFYQVKDALLSWQRSRGEACGVVELEYQADESSWEQIEAFWLAKVDRDQLIRSFFVSVGKVVLCLVTPAGNKIKQIGFELGPK
jgi:hypothetical protein